MKKLFFLVLLIIPVLTRAQVASFTVSRDTICSDSCLYLVNTSTGSTDSITWFIRGVFFSNSHTDTLSVCSLISGMDTIKLYCYRSGHVDSAVQIIHVIATTPLSATLFNFFGSFVLSGQRSDTLKTTVLPAGVSVTYQWEVNGGLITGATDSLYVGNFYRNDTVTCIVSETGSCAASMDVSDRIYWEGAGVSQLGHSTGKITVYPNPTDNELLLSSTDIINEITITNTLGQILYAHYYDAKIARINVVSFPSGNYFINFNNGDNQIFRKR